MAKFSFLQAIEVVLKKANEPLSALEIALEIQKLNLLESSGKTPRKTIDARISRDIKQNGTKSLFKRVSPGRFVLRSHPGKEYDNSPRVLVFPTGLLHNIGYFHGISPNARKYAKKLLRPEFSFFMPRLKAEHDESYKQVVSYVLVKSGKQLLTYSRGSGTSISHLLSGQSSIGFGGHVDEADCNLLSFTDLGYRFSIERELHEEIGIDLKEFPLAELRLVGALNDDSSSLGRQHFAFVHILDLSKYEITQGQHFHTGESSLRSLKLEPISCIAERFAEFEYWSQLCLQYSFKRYLSPECSINVRRKLSCDDCCLLLIVGYIGSGKSEACHLLTDEFGFTLVPGSKVLRDLIGCKGVSDIGRRKFQDIGLDFVSQPGGHKKLAESIARSMKNSPGRRFVLDGLRFTETLDELENVLGFKAKIVFIEATVDNMLTYYRQREDSKCKMSEFLSIVNHPVEQKIERFLPNADVVVFNHGGKDSYINALRKLFSKILKGA